jgi:DNA primase
MENYIKSVRGKPYTRDQVKRVVIGSGITVENEVESDYIIFCPFHNNSRTPAGEIHKSNGLFFCFSCQKTASLVELVMNASSRTYFEAVRFINSKAEHSNIEDDIQKRLTDKPDFVQFDESLIKRLNTQALESPRAMGYFRGRLITDESVVRFGLGFSEKQDMVAIPVHSPDGMVIGFVGRSIEGKEFKNTPGLPKSKALFNLHRVKNSDKVYIVESSFDAIRLDQVGLPAVATMGANVSGAQIDLLRRFFNNVIVIADNDEAGNNMRTKVIEKLGSRISVVNIDGKYKDIGDMDDEVIRDIEFQFDKSILSMLN